jgi:dTDP-4-amino-4,6-dideoxygalactose transaminase
MTFKDFRLKNNDLALFGGPPLFDYPKPTSNLVRPDIENFFQYLLRVNSQKKTSLVEELEQRLAALHGTYHCVTVNSGFWGLALLIDELNLPSATEVVLPSLTYRRMADAIAWTGLVPNFCDIEKDTLANSARTVLPCINDNTALIIGVHPVGGHCDIDGLTSLANDKGIPLIFDSVESAHELHSGKRIGGFGQAEIFSLGASKLINGFEGGYITTNNSTLATRLRKKRAGQGFGRAVSVKLPEIHAAMALSGLDDLPSQLIRNLARFSRYRSELADLPELRLVEQALETEPSHKNIVIEVLDGWPFSRDRTVNLLNAENILARSYYAPPLTDKPMSYRHIATKLPVTNWASTRFISMPCGHLVDTEDISLIIDFLRLLKIRSSCIQKNQTSQIF